MVCIDLWLHQATLAVSTHVRWTHTPASQHGQSSSNIKTPGPSKRQVGSYRHPMRPRLLSQPEMPSSEFLQKAPIGNLHYKKVMWVVVTNLRPIEGWNRRGHRQTMPKYIKIYQNQRLPVSFKSNIKRGHSKHFFRSAVRYWFYGWVGDLTLPALPYRHGPRDPKWA